MTEAGLTTAEVEFVYVAKVEAADEVLAPGIDIVVTEVMTVTSVVEKSVRVKVEVKVDVDKRAGTEYEKGTLLGPVEVGATTLDCIEVELEPIGKAVTVVVTGM